MKESSITQFPTFKCKITNTEESYDSSIEYFLFQRHYLISALGRLRVFDYEWSDIYIKMMQYLSDLTESVIEDTPPPAYTFLVDLSLGDEIENDIIERLLSAKNESNVMQISYLIDASILVREMMFWFVRLSRDQKFQHSFTPERFQGLPFLRLSLVYRSVYLARE